MEKKTNSTRRKYGTAGSIQQSEANQKHLQRKELQQAVKAIDKEHANRKSFRRECDENIVAAFDMLEMLCDTHVFVEQHKIRALPITLDGCSLDYNTANVKNQPATFQRQKER